jgi:hypothetical protein
MHAVDPGLEHCDKVARSATEGLPLPGDGSVRFDLPDLPSA